MLGLPYEPWGETDQTLTMLRAELRALECGCGCGALASDAHNPETEDRWVVSETVCYARRALLDWRDDNPDADEATLVAVRLAASDEELAESKFDPAYAAKIHAAHVAKYSP